ncbi:IclR family transcriptional regulator [Brevundimonas sp.]|uniref:IclR family transcriptional regulator n=1 Tax=Brevundimonas sp. TaxID=1871086 RepID=UPI002AB87BE6|nr:helix-turn-helix domain-containing protein [Brevundimonas sp.]MDZ4363709.1 helix-turn-helix domain-containing protein [Brevundimonas sp.]
MTMREPQKYRAPALEKGLDILMLLARESRPLTMSQMSDRLGRSKGELFRMIQVLEEKGFIAHQGAEEGYAITNMLFALGMEQPPIRGLLEVSLPIMHELAEAIWQSCHLVVASGDQMVVIARVDSPGDISFAVKLGHRRPLFDSTSGRVLFAFQSANVQTEWCRVLTQLHPEFDESVFREQAADIVKRGHARERSSAVRGVIDLSTPIMQTNFAVAALTVPFVERTVDRIPIAEATRLLGRAAEEISRSIRLGEESLVTTPGRRRRSPA